MTNIILQSKSRQLFGTTIRQTTEGMFCITDFHNMYEKTRLIKGWSNRNFQHIFENQKSAEQLYYTLYTAKLINCQFQQFMELVDKDGLLTVLKNFGLYQMKGRGENRLIWANPYIFVYVCMQMNPEIYGIIVTWLTDSLIINRLEASINYRLMNDQVKQTLNLEPDSYKEYQQIASAINYKIFNRNEIGIRNFATKEDLKKILDIEKGLASVLKNNFVKDLPSIIKYINNY